jgi:MoaA/NifB/PqqE/SkfB family radical SAM enzyme
VRIATVFLSPRCDLACRFCGSDVGFDTLGEQDVLQRIESCAAAGYASLVLGGGEPLLWRGDLLRVAAHARQAGMVVQLNTNGVAWREEIESCEGIDRVILPLDGATPVSHDYLRAPTGSHRDIVEDRLRRLNACAKEVTIGTVVCSSNKTELPALAGELARWRTSGLRLHAWHLYRFRPVGRGGARFGRDAELGLDGDEFRRLCAPVQAIPRDWKVYRRPDMTDSRDVDFYWKQDGAWRASGRGTAMGKRGVTTGSDAGCDRRDPLAAPHPPSGRR